jgi:hypothetical protein
MNISIYPSLYTFFVCMSWEVGEELVIKSKALTLLF